jgi:hypothetical protein
MFRKSFVLVLLAVVTLGALGYMGGVGSPVTRVTAEQVIGPEASMAVGVLADVFVALGRATLDALTLLFEPIVGGADVSHP